MPEYFGNCDVCPSFRDRLNLEDKSRCEDMIKGFIILIIFTVLQDNWKY